MKAYLQGADGEEVTLEVGQPDPVEKGETIDKAIMINTEAMKLLHQQIDQDGPEGNYWWIRIIA